MTNQEMKAKATELSLRAKDAAASWSATPEWIAALAGAAAAGAILLPNVKLLAALGAAAAVVYLRSRRPATTSGTPAPAPVLTIPTPTIAVGEQMSSSSSSCDCPWPNVN